MVFGGLIVFLLYMLVRNNCYRDVILVLVINCGIFVFVGVVIFFILGIIFIKCSDFECRIYLYMIFYCFVCIYFLFLEWYSNICVVVCIVIVEFG